MDQPRESETELWRNARTIEDLGEATARWIEGTLRFHPCYYGEEVDAETTPLIGVLAKCNRSGLVTTCSQPGFQSDEEGFAQRACLEGYASEQTAKRIATLGLFTSLLVLIYPRDIVWGYQVPVTVEDYHPFT